MLGVASLLAGGYTAVDVPPEPSLPSVQPTSESDTADAWVQRATVALTSVNRELEVLEQAEEQWRQLPESRRAVVPAPLAALAERRSVLQQRRATLESELDAYRSLRRTQQELTVSEQQLRAVEKALADAPPHRHRSAEQQATLAALAEQHDLRLRRRDAQRAELASLQARVSIAVRTPLPDDGDATAQVSRDVLDMVRNGAKAPIRRVDPSRPPPDVLSGREEDGRLRPEVGTSEPPDRDERGQTRKEVGEQARGSGFPAANRGEERETAPEPGPGAAGPGNAAGGPRPAPAAAGLPPDASRNTLATLRERALEVARNARKTEAAHTARRVAAQAGAPEENGAARAGAEAGTAG